MKVNKFFILIFSLIFYSCSIHKNNNNLIEVDKKNWIDTYKMVVFWSCFRKSYSNDSLVKSIAKKDFIYQIEVLADWHVIESYEEVSKKHAENIKNLVIYPKFEGGDEVAFYKKTIF